MGVDRLGSFCRSGDLERRKEVQSRRGRRIPILLARPPQGKAILLSASPRRRRRDGLGCILPERKTRSILPGSSFELAAVPRDSPSAFAASLAGASATRIRIHARQRTESRELSRTTQHKSLVGTTSSPSSAMASLFTGSESHREHLGNPCAPNLRRQQDIPDQRSTHGSDPRSLGRPRPRNDRQLGSKHVQPNFPVDSTKWRPYRLLETVFVIVLVINKAVFHCVSIIMWNEKLGFFALLVIWRQILW